MQDATLRGTIMAIIASSAELKPNEHVIGDSIEGINEQEAALGTHSNSSGIAVV